jgi:hypothetical protein
MIRLINKYGPAKAMLVFIIVISLLLAMASCSSVRKSQTYHKATIDSTHLKKIDSSKTVTVDSGRLHKVDSTGIIKEKIKTHTEVVIYFDSLYNDCWGKPEDYWETDSVPVKKKGHSIKVSVDKAGSVDVDLGDNKPTRIEINKTGESEKTDSSSVHTTDSSSYHRKDSAHLQATDSSSMHTEVIDKASSKRKFGIPFLIALPLAILFFAFMIYAIWRKVKKKVPG